MIAELITIGDEILIGQIVDTNSAWMARELEKIGVKIRQITSISDNREEIIKTLREAEGRADIILITGGLGPTKDDLTKETLRQYFEVGMKVDPMALENVLSIFNRFNMPILEVNRKQAEVPENCQVIQNAKGTAPGMWFEERGKIFVSMPGVPHEMMGMMQDFVLPQILKIGQLPTIVHQTLLTAGLGESFLAQKIESVENTLPSNIKLAYLPKLGQVRLRLSGYGQDKEALVQEVEIQKNRIISLIPDNLFWVGDGTLSQAILEKLKSSSKTLATAESCTGGFIAKEITSIPGSSKSYLGGVVPYSNDLKVKILGVNPETLHQFGAVSEETVREMVSGILTHLDSDFGLATSGIAGPDGGSPEKPVGLVWVAWGSKKRMEAKKFQFGKDRLVNIERAATVALTYLLGFLKEEW